MYMHIRDLRRSHTIPDYKTEDHFERHHPTIATSTFDYSFCNYLLFRSCTFAIIQMFNHLISYSLHVHDQVRWSLLSIVVKYLYSFINYEDFFRGPSRRLLRTSLPWTDGWTLNRFRLLFVWTIIIWLSLETCIQVMNVHTSVTFFLLF